MLAAVCNHLQESAARVLVFKVFLKVEGQLVDALAQKSNLHLRRASVSGMYCRAFDNTLLFSLCQHGVYGSTARQILQAPALYLFESIQNCATLEVSYGPRP